MKNDPDSGTERLRGRILAIDYGSRRVGLALSDPLGIISQGAGTLANSPSPAGTISALVIEKEVRKVIVGMPYAPDGGKGQKAREVDEFIGALRTMVAVPVEPWDESFTTVEAQRLLLAGGMKRGQRREKERIDEMAARVLLQDYLDSSGR